MFIASNIHCIPMNAIYSIDVVSPIIDSSTQTLEVHFESSTSIGKTIIIADMFIYIYTYARYPIKK